MESRSVCEHPSSMDVAEREAMARAIVDGNSDMTLGSADVGLLAAVAGAGARVDAGRRRLDRAAAPLPRLSMATRTDTQGHERA
jgi:hypothetical protein